MAGSGRVTSWGKSWEMAGDGSTHRPSIRPTNFVLSPDFIPLPNVSLSPDLGLKSLLVSYHQISHVRSLLVKKHFAMSFNDSENQE